MLKTNKHLSRTIAWLLICALIQSLCPVGTIYAAAGSAVTELYDEDKSTSSDATESDATATDSNAEKVENVLRYEDISMIVEGYFILDEDVLYEVSTYLGSLETENLSDQAYLEEVIRYLQDEYDLDRDLTADMLEELIFWIETASGQSMATASNLDLGIGNNLGADEVYLRTWELARVNGQVSGAGVVDGTVPFDTWTKSGEEGPENYVPGNDGSVSNGIVRSFDDVTYNINYVTAMQADAVHSGFKNGKIWMRITIPVSKEYAELKEGSMSWFTVTDREKGPDGEQIITGYRTLTTNDQSINCIPGQGSLYATFTIYAMKNGDVFQPTFEGWIDHNDTEGVCPTHGIDEIKKIEETGVKVSAAPKYNVQLTEVPVGNIGLKAEWDFSTGDAETLDKSATTAYGRVRGYGVTLQLYNDDVNKGMKGIEYPKGPITFDVSVWSTFTPSGGAESGPLTDYTPRIWSFDPNNDVGDLHGRSYPAGVANYAVYAAPGNNYRHSTNFLSYGSPRCYDGGTWTPGALNPVSGRVTIPVTVSDYKIEPIPQSEDNVKHGVFGTWFPNTNLGYGTGTSTYYTWNGGKGPVKNIGSFSAGKIYVVTPFYKRGYVAGEVNSTPQQDDPNYILNDSVVNPEGGSGQFTLHIEDTNFRATSVSEVEVTEQTYDKDDKRTAAVVLTRPGTYDQRILYNYRHTGFSEGYDFQGASWDNGAASNGRDWAPIDYQKGRILWGYHGNASSETSERIVAGNALMLFDPQVLTLDPGNTVHYYSDQSLHDNLKLKRAFLYAAKDPDKFGNSSGGWVNAEGDYDDTEMKSVFTRANSEDYFVYYDSLASLEADGKTCVGVLMEIRPEDNVDDVPTWEGDRIFWSSMAVNVKNDADLVGKVYQTWASSKIWKPAQYGTGVPSMLTVKPGNDTGSGSLPAHTAEIHFDYKKSSYDGGAYIPSNHENRTRGDSLLIVGAKTAVQKHIAQQTIDAGTEAETGEKSSYDINAGQRTADWVITPSASVLLDDPNAEHADIVTSITVTDTIPRGLNYVYNSAYFGGTYLQKEDEDGHKLEGRQGSITGGNKIDDFGNSTEIHYSYIDSAGKEQSRTSNVVMTVTKNSDGTTTLQWTMDKVLVGTTLPQIYYSTSIGTPGVDVTDVHGGDQLLNKAQITSPVDPRTCTSANGNYDEAGIKIVGLAASSLTKQPIQIVVDKGESLKFRLYNSNDYNVPQTVAMMDLLPYAEDGISNFTGELVISELQIQQKLNDVKGDVVSVISDDTLSHTKVYYTMDKKYRSMQMVGSDGTSNLDGDPIKIKLTTELIPQIEVDWTELEVDPATGKVDVASMKHDSAAVVLVCELKGKEVLVADIGLTTTEPASGNIFCNKLFSAGADTFSTGYISNRTLEGTAWLDQDNDGIQDTSEPRFENVKAQLYILDSKGDRIVLDSQLTDSNGHYKFLDVPGGTVYVEFMNSSREGAPDIEKYTSSPLHQGSDRTVDSDAEYKWDEAEQKSLVTISVGMPTADSLKNGEVYESKFNDAGFVPSIWVDNTTANDKGGTVAVLTASDSDAVVAGTEHRESSDGSNNNKSGRVPYDTVIGTPAASWVVDQENIKVNGVKIQPDDNGAFTLTNKDGTAITGTFNLDDGTGAARVYIDDMQVNVDVEIPFKPTIWIENTTLGDLGGQVKAEGGTYAEDNSGARRTENTVYAKAETYYSVDFDNITINGSSTVYNKTEGTVSVTTGGDTITGKVTTAEDGQVQIVFENMNDAIDVGVPFQPGIAVENTTPGNRGGTVAVDGGAASAVSDGVPEADGHPRYAKKKVTGTAAQGYAVDVSSITIGLPGTSHGDTGSNTGAVTIASISNAADDGSSAFYDPFTGKFRVILATGSGSVPVTGTIAADRADRPSAVSVLVDDVPIPLDFGIPFTEQKYIMVDNITENPVDSGATDMGGKVYLTYLNPNGAGSITAESRDENLYTGNTVSIAAEPDTAGGWRYGHTLTCYEYDSETKDHAAAVQTYTFDLSGYLDADGNLTAAGAASLQTELQANYPGASAALVDQKMTIQFPNSGMPRYMEVDISFIPTLWVQNTTPAGGKVSVTNGQNPADSNNSGDHDKHRDPNAAEVNGIPESGYYVNKSHITISSKNDRVSSTIAVKPDGTFETSVATMINGGLVYVPVTGKVTEDEDGTVHVQLKDPSIPLDVHFQFLQTGVPAAGYQMMIDNVTAGNDGGTVYEDGISNGDKIDYRNDINVVSYKEKDGWKPTETFKVLVRDENDAVIDSFELPTPTETGAIDLTDVIGSAHGSELTNYYDGIQAAVEADGKVTLTFVGKNGGSSMPARSEIDVEFVQRAPMLHGEKSSDTPYLISNVGAAGTIHYTIGVTNSADYKAEHVVVRDPIPEHTTVFAMEDGGRDMVIEGKTYVYWTIDSIEVGETVTRSFTVQVPELTAKEARYFKNTAEYQEFDSASSAETGLTSGTGWNETNEIEHRQANGKDPWLGITNGTDLDGDGHSDHKGGTVSMNGTSSKGEVGDELDQETVIWKPDPGFMHSDSFTIVYYKDQADAEPTVKVEVPLRNSDGSMKTEIELQAALMEQIEREVNRGNLPESYRQATILLDADDTITLNLPYEENTESRTKVNVTFVPNSQVVYTKTTTTNEVVSHMGGDIHYVITAENTGDYPVDQVVIFDPIPEFTAFKAAQNGGYQTTVNQIAGAAWLIDTIPAGETVSVSFDVTVEALEEYGTRDITNVAQGVSFGKEQVDLDAVDGWSMTNEVKHVQKKSGGSGSGSSGGGSHTSAAGTSQNAGPGAAGTTTAAEPNPAADPKQGDPVVSKQDEILDTERLEQLPKTGDTSQPHIPLLLTVLTAMFSLGWVRRRK